MNLKAIGDAIAGQYAGIQATNAGETQDLELCTASLPNTITGATGALLVYPPSSEDLLIGVSAIRDGHVLYPVRLLRDPVDVPTRTDWLYAWAAAMQDRVEQNLDLNLPLYVAEAEVVGFRLELDGQEYAGIPYDVVEHLVDVHIHELSVAIGA